VRHALPIELCLFGLTRLGIGERRVDGDGWHGPRAFHTRLETVTYTS